MEHLQAALRATFAAGPAEETITTIARQLGYFGYLTYDAIVWASLLTLVHHALSSYLLAGSFNQIHHPCTGDC